MLESLTTEAEKTIRFLQTRRRKRQAKVKEISKSILDDLDRPSTSVSATTYSTCPICGISPRDEVIDKHVDRCLAETAASEAFRAEVANAERQFQQHIGISYRLLKMSLSICYLRLECLACFCFIQASIDMLF